MYDAGKYWCKVTNQQLGKTNTGKSQFVLSFDVQGKVNQSDPEGDLEPCDNYERSIFRTITPKTVEWLFDDIEHLCERGEIEFALDGFEFLNPATDGYLDLTGVEFEAECKHETYENKPKERWSISTGGGGLSVDPLDDKGVRELNAMFGKQLKSRGSGGSPKPEQPAKPQRETVPPDDGGEIPF